MGADLGVEFAVYFGGDFSQVKTIAEPHLTTILYSHPAHVDTLLVTLSTGGVEATGKDNIDGLLNHADYSFRKAKKSERTRLAMRLEAFEILAFEAI